MFQRCFLSLELDEPKLIAINILQLFDLNEFNKIKNSEIIRIYINRFSNFKL
jgi:hypothetical protein